MAGEQHRSRHSEAVPGRLRTVAIALSLALNAGSVHGASFVPGLASATDVAAETPPPASASTDDYVLALSPIRWWGIAAVDLRYRDLTESGQGRTEVLSGTLNGATYIWQPWFLQVTGGIGLVAAMDQGETAGSARSLNGIGNLDLTLFPVSRFPLNLFADVSDTRASGEITDIDYRSYRFRVSQSYAPEFGNERYFGGFEHSTLRTINSDSEGAPGAGPAAEDTLQVLRLGAAKSWQTQSLEADVSVSRNRREEARFTQQTKLDIATIRHSLLPGPQFSLTSGLSYTRTAIEAPQSQTLPGFSIPGSSSETDFTQFTSFATYRPTSGSGLLPNPNALLATATLRAFNFGNDVDGASTHSRGATASVGLSYSLSPQTQLYATTQAGYVSDGTEDVTAASQSLGINYSADPIPLGPYRYYWTLGSNVLAGFVSGGRLDGSDVLLQANGSQALSRVWEVSRSSSLTASLSQSIGYSYGNRTDGEGVLSTTVTGFWNGQGGENSQAFAGLTFSDSRRFGTFNGYFQLANAQANLQMALSRWSTLAAGLTLQATRAETDQEFVRFVDPLVLPEYGKWNTTFGANVSYTHSRAFGVPRLIYALLFQASSFDVESRALGDVDAPLVQVDWLVDNRLQYPIGRMLLQAGVRWAELQNRGTSFQAFIRVQRNFGAL